MGEHMDRIYKKNSIIRFLTGVLFFCSFFNLEVAKANASIKILSDGRHAYGNITSTINQLLGTGHIGTDIIVHSTNMDTGGSFSINPSDALNTTTQRYDQNGTLVPSAGPYQIFTTSATGYSGDNLGQYNTYAANDLVHNYASTASTNSPPPSFHVAPGGDGWASFGGVEWTIDPVLFCSSTLSCLTGANAGMIAVLRYLHSTSTNPWNWYDTKAALRQTGTKWATGYDKTAYGFGQVNYATANALTDNQILLQSPAVATSTTGVSNQLTFTVYPFKQTRRVKEVLYQFSSAPAFHAAEMSTSTIAALGGTKITEYTGTTATTSAPIFTALTNAYFVWFTADNATDDTANFSRIDTYSVLGPLSQNQIEFTTTFDVATPLNNAISATQSPTFTWSAANSHFGISKYQLYVDGVLNKDNVSGTSATPTSDLAAGTHTWYVKAVNNNGVATTTSSIPTINIVPGYAAGYTFYVDNVLGSDNNPGSQALPWATLTKAGDTAAAGDTVVIIKNAGAPYREQLIPSKDGTSSSNITFRGVDANSKPEIWGSADVSSGWSVYNGGNANTYQQATTTGIQILAAGSSINSLTKKTQGSSATTLNPGEWFWAADILYYRLASGEVINSLHIEASMRDYGISGTSAMYVTFQNIIARYANSNGVYLSNTGQTVQGVEIYDSYQGIVLKGSAKILRYVVAARNSTDGINLSYPNNSQIYNSLAYGNGTNGVTFSAYGGLTSTLKNIISSGNHDFSFAKGYVFSAPTYITSNNLWDIAGDSSWDTHKGTNNQELVDPLLIATSTSNFALKPLSPAIDTGVAIAGLTTDILGNHIYGTPDIGPYEYQPPYTIGTNDIDITGAIRLYNDGKYRYTNATTTGTTASFNVTPVGGFPVGDYSEFLNVSISKWNKSGDYSKTWTETSTTATSTVHTIGNLKNNTYYNILVDSTQYASMLTDGTGQGTFTYAGGYTTHTFDVAEDTGAPVAAAPTIAPTISGSAQTFTWSPASDPSGIAKYQLYTDSTLKEDNVTGTSISSTGFSCGNHTWYVRAIDNAGNATDSSTQSFDVACGGGPVMPAGTVLFDTPKPRMQTIKDGKVTYLDEVASTTKTALAVPKVPQIPASLLVPQATPNTKTPFTRTLNRGSKGNDVKALQDVLKKDRTVYPEGLVTGYFGEATERAVKQFQKKYNIASSGTPQTTGYGVVGPKTRNILKGM